RRKDQEMEAAPRSFGQHRCIGQQPPLVIGHRGVQRQLFGRVDSDQAYGHGDDVAVARFLERHREVRQRTGAPDSYDHVAPPRAPGRRRGTSTWPGRACTWLMPIAGAPRNSLVVAETGSSAADSRATRSENVRSAMPAAINTMPARAGGSPLAASKAAGTMTSA